MLNDTGKAIINTSKSKWVIRIQATFGVCEQRRAKNRLKGRLTCPCVLKANAKIRFVRQGS